PNSPAPRYVASAPFASAPDCRDYSQLRAAPLRLSLWSGGDRSTEALEVGYTDVNGIDRVAWKLSLPAAATVSDVIESCIGSGRHISDFRLLASKDGTVLCGNQPLRDHFPVSRSFGVAATALLNSPPLAGSGSGLSGSSSAALNRVTPLWIVRKPTAPPDDM